MSYFPQIWSDHIWVKWLIRFKRYLRWLISLFNCSTYFPKLSGGAPGECRHEKMGHLCQPQDLAWWKAQNQNQKEAQRCTQAMWQNNVKMCAPVLHLRGNMQAEGARWVCRRAAHHSGQAWQCKCTCWQTIVCHVPFLGKARELLI